jgi:FkbM family methyltransferase
VPAASPSIRALVLDRLTQDERPARLLEQLGAFTWADRLDARRTGGDIVALALPLGPGQLRAKRIKMYGFDGRDQAVREILEHGWRGFEQPTPEVIVRVVRSFDGMVYDIGANSGIYALLAVEARPTTQVVAFEPFPPALEVLRQNLALSRAGSRIEVVAAAVTDTNGWVDLYIPIDQGVIETSASLNAEFKDSDEIAERLAVPATTLDQDWIQRGRPRVSLIKIDTESTEHRVLQGATELTMAERPVIVYEVLPGADVEAIERFGKEHDLVDVRMTVHTATLGQEVGYDPHGWNHLFVPRERLGQIVPILTEARLSVSSVGIDPDELGAGAGPAIVDEARHFDPDLLEPEPVQPGRFLMNLSGAEVRVVRAKRAATGLARAVARSLRRR